MSTATAIALLPMIMELAEVLFSGQGEGESKKSFVIEILQGLLGTMPEISTGGQKKTWTELVPVISPLIDRFASILFK